MAALFLSLALTGCVRRIVTIDSQPPAALVYFDRKLIGETPCTHEFLYYGSHHLELVKEGHVNIRTVLNLKGPFYEYFPLSFFTEVLIPWQITNEHNYNFTLERGEAEKPIISVIEEPQPSLPSPRLERITEHQ